MSTDNHHRWMSDFLSDFLEEMGLPARTEFQGYVLFNLEQNAFIATSKPNPQTPHRQQVKPCAWAHCYPDIMHASDAASELGSEYEIRALFRLDGRHLSCSV